MLLAYYVFFFFFFPVGLWGILSVFVLPGVWEVCLVCFFLWEGGWV